MFSRFTNASFCVVTTPASPKACRFFKGCRLKLAASPKLPVRTPPYFAPTAWAASSSTNRPCCLAIIFIGPIFAGLPAKCTGIIAFVRGVIAASMFFGSIFRSSATSTKTGVAPTKAILDAEATNEFGAVMTSSPAPISMARSTRCKPQVPFATPVAYLAPQ